MKVIIAGGRNFNDYDSLKNKVDTILSNQKEVTIVSGTARGADRLGERYAEENHHKVEKYPAMWDIYGKSAWYKRNEEMAKIADSCVVFWDGKSRGTKHMIDLAKKFNLKLRIIKF